MRRHLLLLFFVLSAVLVVALPSHAADEKTIEVSADTAQNGFDKLWLGLSGFDYSVDANDKENVQLVSGTEPVCAIKALRKAGQTMALAQLGPAIAKAVSVSLDVAKLLVPLGKIGDVAELMIEYFSATDEVDLQNRITNWIEKKGISEALKKVTTKSLEEMGNGLGKLEKGVKPPPTNLDDNTIIDFLTGKIADIIFDKLKKQSGVTVNKTNLNGCDATVTMDFRPPSKDGPGAVLAIIKGDCHCKPPELAYPHLGAFTVIASAPVNARVVTEGKKVKVLVGIGNPTYSVEAQCDACETPTDGGGGTKETPPTGGGVGGTPPVEESVCPQCANLHPLTEEWRADQLEAEAKEFEDKLAKNRPKLEEAKKNLAEVEERLTRIKARLADLQAWKATTPEALQIKNEKLAEMQRGLADWEAKAAQYRREAAALADEMGAEEWLAKKRRADAAYWRAEAKKDREQMEKCKKDKCHPKTIGMIDLRVGGAFDVTKEDDQVAVGADFCMAIPNAPILDACFSPRIQTGGNSTILQLPAAAQLEVPITPQVVFAPRLGVGWSLQTFGQAGSLGSLLVMPEVGGKYLVNDKVEIGADVASLPMYVNDVAFQAQYRAMLYGGFRL